MKRVLKIAQLAFIALSILPIFSRSMAYARLGETEDTVEMDRRAFHGIRKITLNGTYRIQEIVTETNSIREYVNSNGVVFAVAWSGIAHPDLSKIFGAYYPEYLAADQRSATPKGRAPKRIKSANLISLRFGHMRDVHGKAYIPRLVPPGFNLNAIQ